MKNLYPLEGIIAVLNTPFDASGRIDHDALAGHVEYALRCGVSGFLVPALAAEVYKLTDAERKAAFRTVLDAAQNRALVIGCATAQEHEERLSMARFLIDNGCALINVLIPYESDEQYIGEVSRIAGLRPPALMLQDWSAGYGLPDCLIARLFDSVECFRCLKVEIAPAGVKYSRIIDMTDNRLHVSGGWAVTQLIEALDRGVHAFMPTGLYGIYCRIVSLHVAGRRDEAKRLFYALLPVLAFSNQHLDVSIHFFKHLLNKMGIYGTSAVREPIPPIDETMRRQIDELCAYAMDLEKTVFTGVDREKLMC